MKKVYIYIRVGTAEQLSDKKKEGEVNGKA